MLQTQRDGYIMDQGPRGNDIRAAVLAASALDRTTQAGEQQ